MIHVVFSAPYPSEAAVWWAAFHLQCCDVDLPRQSTQVLLFLHLDHCDHHRLQLHIFRKWQDLLHTLLVFSSVASVKELIS